MATMTMIQAIRAAMDVMLERDPNVVVFGEDVGYFGGVFRCTEGLQAKYGASRVFDSPIAEGGIVGAAIGMGAYGLRPVAEIQFADYMYPGYDQIVSGAARIRYADLGGLLLEPDGRLSPQISPDRLHFGAQGYARLVPSLDQLVDQLLAPR